jgi:hypothetical protein
MLTHDNLFFLLSILIGGIWVKLWAFWKECQKRSPNFSTWRVMGSAASMSYRYFPVITNSALEKSGDEVEPTYCNARGYNQPPA